MVCKTKIPRYVLPQEGPKLPFDPDTFLAKAGAGRSIINYRRGQMVFSQGDLADAIFYVQKGKLKITVVSSQGKEAIVAILAAGDFFGEGCLAGQIKRMATATAMTDCATLRLEKSEMIRVLHDEPVFSELFLLSALPQHSH